MLLVFLTLLTLSFEIGEAADCFIFFIELLLGAMSVDGFFDLLLGLPIVAILLLFLIFLAFSFNFEGLCFLDGGFDLLGLDSISL